MKKHLLASALFVVCFGIAHAAAPHPECEAKAVGSNGKPLYGAAKSTFMKKCVADATPGHAECAAKALSKDGKPLRGAAKSTFMKKCVADAAAAK